MMAQLVTTDVALARQAALTQATLLTDYLLLNKVKISFDPVEHPLISIVIVSLNAREMLAATIYRLAASQRLEAIAFELIVVDNESGQGTQDVLSQIVNATIIRNDHNVGFSKGCNIGAAAARGQFVLFVNPDIEFLPGSLSALVKTFSEFDRVGIVGAKLIFPGGTLQEAGASIVDDAQLTHPYMRGHHDPLAGEAAFAREVHYVSGAVLMIPVDLFRTLGGFDEIFSPAYYEDTDLCIRCHQSGHRVVYQPRAAAIHFENATAHARSDVDALLDKNRHVFAARHQSWLFRDGARPAAFGDRDYDPFRLRVLVIEDGAPHLNAGAGLPRANHIISVMVDLGYQVTLYPVHRSDPFLAARYRDVSTKVEILVSDGDEGLRRLLLERMGYYNVVWVSRTHNIDLFCQTMRDLSKVPRSFATSLMIFDMEALFSLRKAVSEAIEEQPLVEAVVTNAIRREVRNLTQADHVVCVSKSEARMLASAGISNVKVLGHAFEVSEDAPGFHGRWGLLFVGSLAREGEPNIDSMDYFMREIWPPLLRKRSDMTLTIVGEIAPGIRMRLTQANVVVMGQIADLGDVLDAARVSIAPTRYAAGIPHKVHGAIARGVPCVVTPILADQVGLPDGVGLLSRDWRDPAAFVDAILDLHDDQALWERVQAQGQAALKRECSAKDYKARVRALCESNFYIKA